MIIPTVFWLVPIASIVALGMAFFFFRQMMAEDEGTPRMREIALYVRNLPDGWFLLWLGRLLRYEDSHLRFCPYG